MIQALTLDLDDTLWPVDAVIGAAEAALTGWFSRHAPRVLERHDEDGLARVRRSVFAEHPHLGHDFTALRRLVITRLLRSAGYPESLADDAFAAFFAARNAVTLYDDVLPALERLARRYPIVAVTNGNADLARMPIGRFFAATVYAREVGALKPDRAVFDRAVAVAGVPAARVCHAGDHLEADVAGARAAGLTPVWVNRTGAAPVDHVPTVTCLGGLADHLGA